MEEKERAEFTNKEILIFLILFFPVAYLLVLLVSAFYLQFYIPIDARFFIFILFDIYVLFIFTNEQFLEKHMKSIFEDESKYKKYLLMNRVLPVFFAIVPNILYWDIAKETIPIKSFLDVFVL